MTSPYTMLSQFICIDYPGEKQEEGHDVGVVSGNKNAIAQICEAYAPG